MGDVGQVRAAVALAPGGHNGGRLHTNDVQVDSFGRLWQCCFNLGICLEGVPQQYGMQKSPHSIAFLPLGTVPIWCGSNEGKVYMGERKLAEWPESFTRGLAVLSDSIVVGLSANRNGAGGAHGQVKEIDFDGNELASFDLPTNEVYAFARVVGT